MPPPAAPALPTRFEPEREFDRILQGQTAGFGVRASALKTELSIKGKDELKFKVDADRDGYLYLLATSTDGTLALLVPQVRRSSRARSVGSIARGARRTPIRLPDEHPASQSAPLPAVVRKALRWNTTRLQ